ncbi:hypothetical protein K4749_17070 [Streptomyces sp. TRM72054]|uniref:hypothetical protein n=1 Tax=Streptomyces sp. TRM72054 TaxID=2870562 RepID=UPI001C8C026E|nr:hypothetical protein [Streptomyces sp. TRM72054]MBX9395261.1 hypothetical protein [Streptomyces sp. TRM72054]
MANTYKVHIALALLLAALSTLIVGLTLLPGSPLLPRATTFVVLGLTFTLFGAAGLRALSAAQSIGPGKLLRMAPSRLVVTAGVLVGGAVVCLAVGGLPSGGQPMKEAGVYYLNSHGDLRKVTREVYGESIKAEMRFFVTWFTFLSAYAAVLVACAHRAAAPDPVRHTPALAPPAPVPAAPGSPCDAVGACEWCGQLKSATSLPYCPR